MDITRVKTRSDQVWDYGETWEGPILLTRWMKLRVTFREARMWMMYEKRDWGSGRLTWRRATDTIPKKRQQGVYAMRRISNREVKKNDLMRSGVRK